MKTRKAAKIISEVLKRLDTALDEKIAKLYPYKEPGNYSGKLDDEFGRNLRNGVIDIVRKAYKDGYKEGFHVGGNQIADWIEENNSEDHSVEVNEKVEPDYIDLGLPSGTLWATCNVGANSPEEYGDYFTHDEALKQGVTLPAKEQIEELINNCSSVWTTQNGKNGRLFTGPNDNTLFLPAAGCYYGSSLFGAGSYGYYWSSSLRTGNPRDAYYLRFNSDYVYWDGGYRGCERSVRAVKNKEE